MPLFYCKYKGFMPLFQDLYLHKLPFFQFRNCRIKLKDRKTFTGCSTRKNRVTTYGEKIGYNDEHSTTLISSMKIAIKKHPVT